MADIFVEVGSAISTLTEEDITNEDVFEALYDLSSAGNYIGLPVDQAKTMVEGLEDIIEGDTKVGIAKLLGWSSYHAEGLSSKPTSRRSGSQNRSTTPSRRNGTRSNSSVVPRVRRSAAPSGGVPRIR